MTSLNVQLAAEAFASGAMTRRQAARHYDVDESSIFRYMKANPVAPPPAPVARESVTFVGTPEQVAKIKQAWERITR